jgi:hypothetical protein
MQTEMIGLDGVDGTSNKFKIMYSEESSFLGAFFFLTQFIE